MKEIILWKQSSVVSIKTFLVQGQKKTKTIFQLQFIVVSESPK